MKYDYDNLLSHCEHHNIKNWLIKGAEQEDARTILDALDRQSPHRLRRKLAEILAHDRTCE